MKREISEQTLNQLRSCDSPTISNAIESFGVRPMIDGFASMELACHFPDLPPMVGYAVTCIADSTSAKPSGPDRLKELFEAVAASAKPSIVVLQHAGPDRQRSCFA